ncbi:MAG: 3-ketoacyl-ACP reductase [Planctomycetota bacterium]
MSGSTRRVALVTGGSRGIGLGIAKALAQAGLRVVINGRRPPDEVSAVMTELAAVGGDPVYCQADISDLDEHPELLETIRQQTARLDVLVNNAGVGPAVRADLLDATPESFDRLMQINLRGPYFLTQQVARWMIAQREADPQLAAAIVNVTSISAAVASTNRGDYCISKAGLAMSSQLWATRLAEYGIPVYEVRPGIIRTDMTAGVSDHYDQLLTNGLTLQPRWGEPEDVGRAVAALATESIPYATGAVIPIDGGLMVQRL